MVLLEPSKGRAAHLRSFPKSAATWVKGYWIAGTVGFIVYITTVQDLMQ